MGDCLSGRPPPPAHRDGEKIKIPPGGVIEGEIDLAEKFKGLYEIAKNPKHRPLVVYWSHKPQLFEGPVVDRQGGWLLIGKER